MLPKQCPNCGNTYQPKRQWQIYCRPSCGAQAYQRRRLKREIDKALKGKS